MENILFTGNIEENDRFFKDFLVHRNEKMVILDFKKNFEDNFGNDIIMDKVNPILGEQTLSDAMALNAGFLGKGSQLLYRTCVEILAYEQLSAKDGLIAEAVERLKNGWTNTEQDAAKAISKRAYLKPSRSHFSLDTLIQEIFSELQSRKSTRLRTKSMNSNLRRAVIFHLISRISHMEHSPISFVIDNTSSLFDFGNSKLFLESVQLHNISFIARFAKTEELDPDILNVFTRTINLDKQANKKQLLQFV